MVPVLKVMDHPIGSGQAQVSVVDDPQINAGSAGSGQFVVTSGLLQRANDDQLQAVMAHEVAHDDLGHVAKTQRLGAGLNIATVLLDQVIPGSSVFTPIAGTLAIRAYGRKEEYEADKHGVELLRKINPNGKEMMVNALTWLRANSGEQRGRFLRHPSRHGRPDRQGAGNALRGSGQSPDMNLIDTCYRRSLHLLRCNSTAAGILASTRTRKAADRHYASIFGRDAAICALGMVASGEPDLMESAHAGLLTLARHQAPNGQIPKYVKPETGEVDFWYTGCIDATLWWLIAVDWADRAHPGSLLDLELVPRTRQALRWLECQEHQAWYLLQQNEASDWADIMPRSGFVLYTNALWFWVKKAYGLSTARWTRDYANLLFCPFGNAVPEQRRARLLMHYIRNRAKRTPFLP